MKPKLLIAYLILVTVPLVVLGWLGVRTLGSEQERIDRQFERLTEESLREYARDAEDLLGSWAQEWESLNWNMSDRDAVRAITRTDGRVHQFFALNADGSVVFPIYDDAATAAERDFLLETEDIWESGSIHPNQLSVPETNTSRFRRQALVAESPRGRWHTWYRQEGLQLIYFWAAPEGGVFGLQLDRVRMQAEMVGILPDTPENIVHEELAVRLLDEAGDVLYQWGALRENDDREPIASIPMNTPLQTWTLEGFLPATSNDSQVYLLGLTLAAVATLFLLVGIYVYRENTRELREAEQRVNFVNHVSHELKTPLTNIRMYADLLQDELPVDDEKAVGRLGVILNESERLSRLITNVLTFNRSQRSGLQLHPRPVDPDRLVRGVIGKFQQSFGEKNISVEFRPGVLREVMIDADVVEQIVGNLLSNVEKYAGGDQTITVATGLVDGDLEVHVQDYGPGIPPAELERVFEAFHRVRNDLTEGVAGTGIGLSIARDLAQLHGGDIELIPEERGAHFCLYVRVQGEVA